MVHGQKQVPLDTLLGLFAQGLRSRLLAELKRAGREQEAREALEKRRGQKKTVDAAKPVAGWLYARPDVD
jgi:hypothetical protein